MRSKIIIVLAIVIFLALSAALIVLVSKNGTLDQELGRTKSLAKRMEIEIAGLNKDKESLTQEKEKLQSDATSYLAINTKVTQEKEKLQEALEKAKKTLDDKEANLGRMKLSLEKMEKEAAAKKGTTEGNKLDIDVKKLQKKVAELEKKAEKDRATFYYNLGVAYTQAKYYDDAIDSYEKSLKLDNSNAEAHYNIALIYSNAKEEPGKAIGHYRTYLKLKPNAPDKEEVEALINSLK